MAAAHGGHWAPVLIPGNEPRRDWIPDDQPPSPDGTDGRWHLVGEPGGDGRWEWHPFEPGVAAPARPPAPLPAVGPPLDPRRLAFFFAVLAGCLLTLFLVVTWGDDEQARTGAAEPSSPSQAAGAASSGPSLTFPMTVGDWSLGGFQVAEDPSSGTFAGTAWVYYLGSDRDGASTPFTIGVFDGGQEVGVLTGTARDVKPGTFLTVALNSRSPWVENPGGFTFTPAAR